MWLVRLVVMMVVIMVVVKVVVMVPIFTLTATGVGPVDSPKMSMAVPWKTSPNSPRSIKLGEFSVCDKYLKCVIMCACVCYVYACM